MTAKKIDPAKAAPRAPQISAATFPALRQFLRGYLHEDWQDEYDSPVEATQQFCDDASPEECRDLAQEWDAFRQQVKNLSLPAISGLLGTHLGAGVPGTRARCPDYRGAGGKCPHPRRQSGDPSGTHHGS